MVGHDRESGFVGVARLVGLAGMDEEIAEERRHVGAVLGRECRRLAGLPHRRDRAIDVAVQLAQVGETGERREVDAEPDQLLARHDGFLIAPKLDERVHLDRLGGDEGGCHRESLVRRLQRGSELVPPQLETTEPDENERVAGCKGGGSRQGFLRLAVEGRIGQLTDPLQKAEAQIAESDGVVGVCGDAGAKGRDVGGRSTDSARGGGRGRRRRDQRRRRRHDNDRGSRPRAARHEDQTQEERADRAA